MADAFVAEIRIFAGNFAPKGWALCNGQILPLAQNTALFSLLGTTYGGDGRSTFALPDFQGIAPMQQGQGPGLSLRELGETGGVASVALQLPEIPQHTHRLQAGTGSGTTGQPSGARPATANAGKVGARLYGATPSTPMSGQAMSVAGQSAPHNNMPPYLALTFIIALQGVFPPRG